MPMRLWPALVLATGHDIGQLFALAGVVATAAALAAMAAPWARGWLAEARC